MASLGSKVLQIRSVEFAGKYKVPLRVLSSFKDGPGTLITIEDDETVEKAVISGIAFNRDEAKLTVVGVPDIPGVASRILGPISRANIEVDMIVQNIGADQSTDFTFTVHRNDYVEAQRVLEQVVRELVPGRVLATTKLPRYRSSGLACAPMRGWPAECSMPWRRRISTSR